MANAPPANRPSDFPATGRTGSLPATAAPPAATGPVPHRLLITLCTVGATLMQALDQTIANVALPYMQGSLSATFDEITWVLTSYITAAAIMTAPVGWLAARFGRKYLFITCLIGFTLTSMMCGAAQSLTAACPQSLQPAQPESRTSWPRSAPPYQASFRRRQTPRRPPRPRLPHQTRPSRWRRRPRPTSRRCRSE